MSLCKRFSKLKRKPKNEPALWCDDYSFLGADNALSSTLHFETGHKQKFETLPEKILLNKDIH